MTPTPRDDPKIGEAWKKIWSRVRKNGGSLRQACLAIVSEYGCSLDTARRHVDPSYHSKSNAWARRSENRRYARLKKERQYHRAYKRLLRTPERLLAEVFDQRQQSSLDEIATAIRENEGLPASAFQAPLIERTLRIYMQRVRGPPFLSRRADGIYEVATDPPTSENEEHGYR